MTTDKLIRMAGLVGLLTGALWALYEIGEIIGLVPITLDPALDQTAHGILVFVIIGLYARQAAQAGWFGATAFVIYLTGLMVNQGMKAIFTLVAPTLTAQFPAAAQAVGIQPSWGIFTLAWTTLTFLGPVLFGIATLRARVLPRWAAILLIIGPILSMAGLIPLPGNPGAVITALGIAGLSYGTWSMKGPVPAHRLPAVKSVAS